MIKMKTVRELKELFECGHGPMGVAIGGGTGSGKSTLAKRLLEALEGNAVIIEQDSYYKCLGHQHLTERERTDFDSPGAVDLELFIDHIRNLKLGESIERPIYDFHNHTRAPGFVLIEPKPVVIVEGLFVLHDPELRGLFDLTVFVDADADVRLVRRIRRDIRERGRTAESVISRYMRSVRPMHEVYVAPCREYADIVMDTIGGTDELGHILKSLCALAMERKPLFDEGLDTLLGRISGGE